MSRKTLKNNRLLSGLLYSAVALLLTLSSFTQAQSNKSVQKATLAEAVERVSPTQIRVKSGFKLVLVDDGWVVDQVVGKEVRRLEKRIKCSSCPGGNCRSRLNGTCAPRNSCTSSTCLIDPF